MTNRQAQRELDKSEIQALSSFSAFCQPVELYNVLNERQSKKPVFLRRTVCYSATNATTIPPESCPSVSIEIQHGQNHERHHRSFVVALCRKLSNEAWLPLTTSFLHLEDGTKAAKGQLRVPELGAERDSLHILFISRRDLPDLRLFAGKNAKRLSHEVSEEIAFRFLNSGALLAYSSSLLDLDQSKAEQISLKATNLELGAAGKLVGKGQQSTGNVLKLRAGSCTDLSFLVLTKLQPSSSAASTVGRECQPSQAPDTLDKGEVYHRYLFDNDRRYYVEKSSRFSCPFCPMRCINLWGLQQHMEASHSLFDFSFPEDHPDVLRAVNVRCGAELKCAQNRFRGDLLEDRNALRKVHAFFCPKGLRRVRSRQYDMPLRKRQKLPKHITRALMDVWSEDDKDAEKEATGAATKPKTKKRVRGADQPKSKPTPPVLTSLGRQRFHHARSHMPMLEEEVRAILDNSRSVPDSDDEDNIINWKERCRRKLRAQTELSNPEREFMFNWNVFLHQNPVQADLQVPETCKQFAEGYVEVLASNGDLRRCFVSHSLLLWEYGLMDSAAIDACMAVLQ